VLNKHFHIFEKALPKEFCEYLIKSATWEKSETAKVNRVSEGEIDLNARITDIYWEELLSPIGCVVQSYIVEANKNWNYDIRRLEKVQMSKYSEGGHYKWHMDSKAPVNNEQRKLSISILLNDNFEGGNLEIESNKDENVLKCQGDIVVFPSFLQHRVLPVTDGTRYTAVSWAYGPTFR
jgi:PKHD-type hydroxylase